jgi:hypothetical protein
MTGYLLCTWWWSAKVADDVCVIVLQVGVEKKRQELLGGKPSKVKPSKSSYSVGLDICILWCNINELLPGKND